jgi:hypothetical protein
MPQGSKAEFQGAPSHVGFLECGGNEPDDILKFP